MRLGDKGQGAMEYLMTYGWAILVVMIVGVVLWQLGVFGGAGGGVNRATGFTTLKPFDRSIKYTDLGATEVLNATFTNAAGTPVVITAVSATGDCTRAVADDASLMEGGGAAGVDVPVAGGGTVKFSCTTALGVAAKNSGDTFATTITINYTESVAGTTIARSDSGRITGTVEV